MIFNITNETFGGPVRMGDLLAVCNVVEHLRQKFGENVKFHMLPGSIYQAEHCNKFYNLLLTITDYFSETTGQIPLGWKNVNLWDYRDISGDLVKIKNDKTKEKKIVIFPLFDSKYNTYRNWPNHICLDILNTYNKPEFSEYSKFVCTNEKIPVEQFGYTNSTDFIENINHIMTSSVFVGGDTGTTHFAFSLIDGPKHLEYVGSSRALVHTLPFYLMQGKGKFTNYWLDMEGSDFRTQ